MDVYREQLKRKILWITRSSILIALLIILQVATAPLGQFVTGSIVNLILAVSVMTCGLATGLSVAAISPVMAKLWGIGLLWSLIPFIAAGNIVFVILWHCIGNRNMGHKCTAYVVALIAAAIAKFLVLYIGIVRVAIPMILSLPEQQAAVISIIFSIPQLITALIGGGIAALLLPALKSATGENQQRHCDKI